MTYTPTTTLGPVNLHAEDDCHATAQTVDGSSWVRVGPVAIFGSLDTLGRLAAEMAAAVEALRPSPVATLMGRLEESLAAARAAGEREDRATWGDPHPDVVRAEERA